MRGINTYKDAYMPPTQKIKLAIPWRFRMLFDAESEELVTRIELFVCF